MPDPLSHRRAEQGRALIFTEARKEGVLLEGRGGSRSSWGAVDYKRRDPYDWCQGQGGQCASQRLHLDIRHGGSTAEEVGSS